MKSWDPIYQKINQNCNSKFLILCDHASNFIPSCISDVQLGLRKEELNRHIAYDIGAKNTAIELSNFLMAPLIASNFSRLIIDPNRSKDDPTSIMQIYDGTKIPGNCNLTRAEIKLRQENFYNPYHKAISNFIKSKRKKNIYPCLISIHSFTPQINHQSFRPWHVGVLWDQDTRMSNLIIKELAKNKNFCIGKNEPYKGNLTGDTLSRHGTSNNLLHVLIEIRNDLITDAPGQKKWANILGNVLNKSIKRIKE